MLCLLSIAFCLIHRIIAADVQCSSKIEGLETCLDRLQKGSDYQVLKQKRQHIWHVCAQKNNNTYQPCLEQLMTVDSCQQQIQSNPDVLAARKQLLTDFDQCFKQQFPFNPLIVLKPPQYGGPLQTPGGPLCPQMPPIAPAFMMPPPPPMHAYGHGAHPQNDAPQDQSNMAYFPGKAAGAQHSQHTGTESTYIQGYPQCASFMDCVVQGELQLNSDVGVVKSAKAVHGAQHKCLNDNVPPYECTPGSPQIADCIATANLNFEDVKQSVLMGCLQPDLVQTAAPTTAQPTTASPTARGRGRTNNKNQGRSKTGR